MPDVSVIMPTMGRAEQALRCIYHLHETAGHPFELVVVVEADPDGWNYLAGKPGIDILSYREEHRGPVAGWNEGAQLASGDVLALVADDLAAGEDWLAIALGYLGNGVGFVGFNDGHRHAVKEKNATHFLATRDHLRRVQNGVMAIPVYRHYGFDNEMTERAMAAGEFVWAEDALLRHDHPQWGSREWDETYQAGKPWRERDRELFFKRKDTGFPDDFEPILEAV